MGNVERSKAAARRLWAAANYSANAFIKLSHVDLTDKEVAEAIAQPDIERLPPTERRQSLRESLTRGRVATLALLMHDSPLSRLTIRELMHPATGDESEFSDNDLEDIARVLDEIHEHIFGNVNTPELRQKLDYWLDNVTVTQRRSSVLQQVAFSAGPKVTLKQTRALLEELAARSDRRFAGVDARQAHEILQQVDTAGSTGGRWPNGTRRIGVIGAAAKLSVLAGAFGDVKEHPAKRAYADAETEEDKAFAKKRKEARTVVKRVERRAQALKSYRQG